MINSDEYSACIEYINKQWKILSAKTEKDKGLIIGLPNPYVCPSRDEFDRKMYYWDSYFIILGLLCSGKVTLAKGMAENLFYLLKDLNSYPKATASITSGNPTLRFSPHFNRDLGGQMESL